MFQRSGGSSDSISETSSIGRPEEITREESTNTNPSTSTAPETLNPLASDVTLQKTQETLHQVNTLVETEKERQTEGQEVEQSGR